MWDRLWRGYAERWRRNWPNPVAILVFFVTSEVLDDEDGGKSWQCWVASAVVGLAVLLVIRWVRAEPSTDPSSD